MENNKRREITTNKFIEYDENFWEQEHLRGVREECLKGMEACKMVLRHHGFSSQIHDLYCVLRDIERTHVMFGSALMIRKVNTINVNRRDFDMLRHKMTELEFMYDQYSKGVDFDDAVNHSCDRQLDEYADDHEEYLAEMLEKLEYEELRSESVPEPDLDDLPTGGR